MEIRIFENKSSLAKTFSEDLKFLINANESVHIALSGGSTPKAIFDHLAKYYSEEIYWKNVHFYWGDERCVGPEDDQSNYKMTMDHLFSKINIPSENIHRILGENAPANEAKSYSNLLAKNLELKDDLPSFDLVILGMGDDGHTASIFPHEISLFQSSKICDVAIHPDSGQKRITITGEVINNAKKVVFLVTGSNKQEKLGAIMEKKAGYKKYPAALVSPRSNRLIWYLDKSAVSGIDFGKIE